MVIVVRSSSTFWMHAIVLWKFQFCGSCGSCSRMCDCDLQAIVLARSLEDWGRGLWALTTACQSFCLSRTTSQDRRSSLLLYSSIFWIFISKDRVTSTKHITTLRTSRMLSTNGRMSNTNSSRWSVSCLAFETTYLFTCLSQFRRR